MKQIQDFSPQPHPGSGGCTAEDLVRTALRFQSDVTLWFDGGPEVSAKNLPAVLQVTAERPRLLTVATRGDDAMEAMEAVIELCGNGFLACRDLPQMARSDGAMLGDRNR